MPSPGCVATGGNEESTTVPDRQMPLDMGPVGPKPKTEASKATGAAVPVSGLPSPEPSVMPQRPSVANDDDVNSDQQAADTMAGVVTHVAVTPEQVRITMRAVPDFEPATCYVDAATDGPVYEKSKFTRVGDRLIVALSPSDQHDTDALRATEVWVAMTAPRWFTN